jgi:cytochrome b561
MIQWRNSEVRYGTVAQMLHWTIFALIVLQFVSAELIDAFARESAGRVALVGVHESLGLATVALVLIRLLWSIANPGLPGHGPAWQQRLARAAHTGLYGLMIAVPAVGYVVAAARGHDLALFGFTLPELIGRDRALARTAKEVHEALAWTMAALVGIHAGAAIWHHVVVRDATLRRMLPWRTGMNLGLPR